MGGKRKARDKFSRYESNSESESSDSDELDQTRSAEKSTDSSGDNLNSSNSVESTTKNQKDSGNSSKFLVTRSKRKYNKPELVIPEKRCKLVDPKSNLKSDGSESFEKVRPKRQTLKGLDQKIEKATSFLEELNKRIVDRDAEIVKLKKVISENRHLDERDRSKENDIFDYTSNMQDPFKFLGTDPDDEGDVAEQGKSEDEDDIETIYPIERDSRKRGRNSDRKRKRSKENKRSRSRSHSRGGHRKRSRSRSPMVTAVASTKEDLQSAVSQYQSNPAVQELVKKLVAEQVEKQMEKVKQKKTTSKNFENLGGRLKSMSDSTLYVPAVPKVSQSPLDTTPNFNNSRTQDTHNETAIPVTPLNDDKHIDRALTQMRLFSGGDGNVAEADTSQAVTNSTQQRQMSRARSAADTAIIEAERFKAQIQPGKGISFNNKPMSGVELEELRHLRYLDMEDDEFFHTTCHIDTSIKEKIAKGGFVELDKLLQKKLQFGPKDERMQLINKDGVTFFAPPIDRETRIDGIKKWEQAFRVYSTIYCDANPSRAGEILQYVDIIHRAAAIFNWDNVARYDYVFRQLMATKPHRSWAKVYTQMWNITLNEPIKKFNDGGYQNRNGSNSNAQGKKKNNVCWKYNKNTCTYGKNCRFEHKCSYCNSNNHPVTGCPKKQGKKDDKK